MPTFRYNTHGRWYKGNTHLHSTASDGDRTIAELTETYSGAGYDFLCLTDHWVAANIEQQEDGLLWLDGVELDGKDSTGANFHVVGIGTFQNLTREMGLEQAMRSIREQGGLLILAHPQWMGNSFDDARRWQFDGVEIYNNVCRWLNGKGDGSAYWNAMLERFPNTLAVASDDAHFAPGEEDLWHGGWIVVNAEERTREAIFNALRAGNYYSSRGPAFHAIQYDGEQVSIECSPVRYIRMVGQAWNGERLGLIGSSLLTSGAFKVPEDWAYIYLELEDDQGRTAWSNPLFVKE